MNGDGTVARPVVIKVGGSLLDLDDLTERLTTLIGELKPSPVAIVAGGGAAADVVRAWDRRFRFDSSTSHWLAIRAVGLNEALLARVVSGCALAETWNSLAAMWREGTTAILSIGPLLRAAEEAGESMPPHSWDVTSDSIAVWAAGWLGARLVLAKSVDAPGGSADDAIAAGLVDRWFGKAVTSGIDVDWVNLRGDERRVVKWLRAPKPTALPSSLHPEQTI
jgi:5-(aminomethyl)-3-furanmethanol phosphate kinase